MMADALAKALNGRKRDSGWIICCPARDAHRKPYFQTSLAPVRRSEPDREAENRTAAARAIWAATLSAILQKVG